MGICVSFEGSQLTSLDDIHVQKTLSARVIYENKGNLMLINTKVKNALGLLLMPPLTM